MQWNRDYSYWSHPFEPAPAPSAAAAADPIPGDAPSTLDPNFWALEIMGMLAYYHMLSNREASVTKGSAEDTWLQGQMAYCVKFLKNAQAAEAAFEKANPGQTYLSKSFCDILTQSTIETGTSGFGKWWLDNLMSLDGTGQSFMDWFQPMATKESDLPQAGQSQADLLGLAFASSMMFTDLDNTPLGQMGGADAFFNPYDWTRPSHPFLFPSLAPEMVAFFIWNESGSPQPSDPVWSAFTANLGFMGNLLNPANLPAPGPTNYADIFWKNFTADQTAFDNKTFPEGDTLDTALKNFLQAFDTRFID